MLKLKLIKVQGKIYSQLGLYGGRIYLGNPYNVNNDVVKDGVIWEMQPFFEKVPFYIYFYFNFIRYFKKDVFNKSEYKSQRIRFKTNVIKIINNLFYLE
jgi:hypothetical protein